MVGDTISGSSNHQGPKKVKTIEFVEEVKTSFGQTLLQAVAFEKLLWVVSSSTQLWSQRLGTFFGLPLLKQPNNAKTRLVPAIDAVVTAAPLLYAEAPAVLAGIDMDALLSMRKRLLNLRAVISCVAVFNESLQALESHLENALDSLARQIHKRTVSLMETHRHIGKELAPLQTLVSEDAQAAVETRRALDKARQEGRADLLKEQADKTRAELDKDRDRDKGKTGDHPVSDK